MCLVGTVVYHTYGQTFSNFLFVFDKIDNFVLIG
jgi:hypothetical protein